MPSQIGQPELFVSHTISGNKVYGVVFITYASGTMMENTITGNLGGRGVTVQGSSFPTIVHNNITGNGTEDIPGFQQLWSAGRPQRVWLFRWTFCRSTEPEPDQRLGSMLCAELTEWLDSRAGIV
jgi:parallel beta-helix repeat protein